MHLILKVDHNDLCIANTTKQKQQTGRSREDKMSENDENVQQTRNQPSLGFNSSGDHNLNTKKCYTRNKEQNEPELSTLPHTFTCQSRRNRSQLYANSGLQHSQNLPQNSP